MNLPGTEFERGMRAQGCRRIAGIDEAGRGCWAGPVVAAAVVLPPALLDDPGPLAGVNDSKQLSAARREALFARITQLVAAVGVGVVPAYLIDWYGIVPATRLAMQLALLQLPCIPDGLLIDALQLPLASLPQQALIHGDARCLSIAAASIIAKVTRDRIMCGAELAYPGYGFAAHKGYGTAAHAAALQSLGLCELHRRSFRPLAAYC